MNKKARAGLDHIGVSAGAVITNTDDKYFLARRTISARDDHSKWEFPGGSVHKFENREDAALRNINQKYGMYIKIDKLLGVYDVIDEEAGDHWLSTTYLCSHVSGEPTITQPDKCDKVGWFSMEELKDMELSRITMLNLKDLL